MNPDNAAPTGINWAICPVDPRVTRRPILPPAGAKSGTFKRLGSQPLRRTDLTGRLDLDPIDTDNGRNDASYQDARGSASTTTDCRLLVLAGDAAVDPKLRSIAE
jgi:hypothetical protein